MTTTDSRLARHSQQAIEERTERGLTVAMVSEMTGYDPAQIALVSRTVAQGAPLQELAVFLHACKTLQLDPLLRQAYWIRRKSGDEWKGALQVGIDGFRAIAERSGAYAGSEPPRYLGQIEVAYQGRTIIAPERAQVVVWKIVQGHKAAFTGEANWTEFYPGEKDGFMYRKMPRHMLAKDAEAQALRKAFPALLSGVQISPMAEGEASTTVTEQEDEHEQVALNAAKHDQIWGAEYPDDGTGAEEGAVPMVTSTSSPEWKRWQAVVKAAHAAKLEVPAVDLPLSVEALNASITSLREAVADAEQAPLV